jgi:phosphoglucomutase
MDLKFGTSGWRGIIADDFTAANARLVCQGIADYVKQASPPKAGLVIGYDTRFRSEDFAALAAEIMAGNGIPSYLGVQPIPTPVVTFAILAGQHAGGITVTASHNPGVYNGIKFSPAWGGPAPSEVTKIIEGTIRGLQPDQVQWLPLAAARDKGLVRDLDPREAYLEDLATKIDLGAIRRAGLKIVVDPLYGTAVGYLDRFLLEVGAAVTLLHDWRDPYFGGQKPEPNAEALFELSQTVRETGAHLGLAVDPDADRFGVVDHQGDYHPANLILALLLDYLVKTRGWRQGVARSVVTSHLLDRVAALHGLPVYETKVGFKHLAPYLCNQQAAMIGEEADGFSMQGHLPEKDGILACLLIAEMVARTGKDIPQLRDELFRQVGPSYTRRVDLQLSPEAKTALLARLEQPPSSLAGQAVTAHQTLEGHKFLLADGSWIALRPSGTEPVVRVYLEADSPEHLAATGPSRRHSPY